MNEMKIKRRDNALNALQKEFDVSSCPSPKSREMRFMPVKGEVLQFCGYRKVIRNGFSWCGALFASRSIKDSFIFIAVGKLHGIELKEFCNYTATHVSKTCVVLD